MIRALMIFSLLLTFTAVFAESTVYDLVIENARVIDPETGTDLDKASIGITGGTVMTVGRNRLSGRETLDAKGLVACPGFIDVLSYSLTYMGMTNKLLDGVTVNLALHGDSAFTADWYRRMKAKNPMVHYGTSFFTTEARTSLGLSRYDTANAAQTQKLVKMAEKALQNGALGISFSLEYNPGIGKLELKELMKVAARYHAVVFFHTRYSDTEEPGTSLEGLDEVLDMARETGAQIHIDHINSTGGTYCMPEALAKMRSARSQGVNTSACIYPYHYWATYLSSARFDGDWQKRFRISYSDLQIGGKSERLTEKTFQIHRRKGTLAVAYAMQEDETILALKEPYMMIGSDAILVAGHNNHPRASGAFCRVLGRYVRELKALTLIEGIARMTINPARRLEEMAPALKKKGRLSPGADADILLINPDTIGDAATVERPDLPSKGVEYILMNGKIIKDQAGFRKVSHQGRPILSDLKPGNH